MLGKNPQCCCANMSETYYHALYQPKISELEHKLYEKEQIIKALAEANKNLTKIIKEKGGE